MRQERLELASLLTVCAVAVFAMQGQHHRLFGWLNNYDALPAEQVRTEGDQHLYLWGSVGLFVLRLPQKAEVGPCARATHR